MKKFCINCEYSNYTGNQIGYAEKEGIPLSQSSDVYCCHKIGKNKQNRGYVKKDFSCNDFEIRTTPLRQKTFIK